MGVKKVCFVDDKKACVTLTCKTCVERDVLKNGRVCYMGNTHTVWPVCKRSVRKVVGHAFVTPEKLVYMRCFSDFC